MKAKARMAQASVLAASLGARAQNWGRWCCFGLGSAPFFSQNTQNQAPLVAELARSGTLSSQQNRGKRI